MLTFPYALLVAFIVHSITAIAKNPPTTHDMEVASRKMKEFKTPVVFRPTASDFLYVKDNELKVWIIDMDDSFLLGSGAQGSVRRAWRATVGVPPAKAPQYVVKQIDVDKSEDISKAPYTNEIDVLKALERAPSHLLVSKQDSLGPQDEGTVQSEYKKCKSIQSRTWGYRCNQEAAAFIFQLLIPGTSVLKLDIYFNPEAMANIQEGARRELKKLHKLGWVHGDAHAGNFLAIESDIPNQYSVTMIDFGLSHKVNKQGTNVERDFVLVDRFLPIMKLIRFDIPFKYYCGFDHVIQLDPSMEKYFEEQFGHVEDWRTKFDRLKELHFAAVRWGSDGSPSSESIESLPYFQSLFKQTMTKDTVALLPNTHAVRRLEDAQLAKSSLETAIRKLSNAYKRAFDEDTRGRYLDAWSRAQNALVALSHKIVKLQSTVAREVRVRQPSSRDKFEEAKEAKLEEAEREEAKFEEAKFEEAKREEAKREEAKREEAKREEAKREEAKREEAKRWWEDRIRAETAFKSAQASPQPSSSNSFSFSLLETMSTAAGLVYFALAVTL